MKFPFQRFIISGSSMEPTFKHGDRVLVNRWAAIRAGDVILFRKNGITMVKRAAEKMVGDRWEVGADNQNDGLDSDDFGSISGKLIIGKVIANY